MPAPTRWPSLPASRRGVMLAALGSSLPAWAGAPVGCETPPCTFGPTANWPAARSGLENILTRSLLPFWRRVADASTGEGYQLNHDIAGRWLGPANLALVTQARMLWFFAHVRRHGWATAADDRRAERGLAILVDRFRDKVHGGYFWQLRYKDYAPSRPDKQLYAQSFALFALSEHALVSGSASAAAAAAEAFAVIDAHFRDATRGNYAEFLLRDWSVPSPTQKDYLGALGGVRTQNTRIHLLEALTTHYELVRSATVANRLTEVMELTERALVRTPAYFFREKDGGAPSRQSYGHDLETIHVLMRGRALLGRCGSPPAFYDRVVDDAFRLAEDRGLGGVYESGPAGGVPDTRGKKDWIQAEALLTLGEMFRLTRKSARKAAFFRTLDWIGRWQVDWVHGAWYDTIDPALRPVGGKAGPWGGPYHTGRAVLGSLTLIDAITASQAKGGCSPI